MRQRFKYDRESGEVLPAHIVEAKQAKENPSFYLLPDLDVAYGGGFESPIDGQFITSRAQLREHNIRHDVMQAGDDHGQHREKMRQHMKYDPSRRGDGTVEWKQARDPRLLRSGNLTEI